MTQQQNEILQLLNSAIGHFNTNEQYLIRHDLSERCICSKFAMYLEKTLVNSNFSDYIVDVEYNRGMNGNPYAAKMIESRNIIVDLIVHKRGYDEQLGFDNLFCIEMKKGRGIERLKSDKKRLKILTDERYGFCYKAGFMLAIINSGRSGVCGIEIEEAFFPL